MKIVERIPAHHEEKEVETFGRVYKWCPEQVVLECDACGTRTTYKHSKLMTSIVTCECGARSSTRAREELLVEYWPRTSACTHGATGIRKSNPDYPFSIALFLRVEVVCNTHQGLGLAVCPAPLCMS